MPDTLDPSLLVDCRSTPRRPLTDPDLTHDWTPQHYPSGAIGGYYCPDCLIAGAPTSTLCPDRVGALLAEVRRLREERDKARAALATARIDGVRVMQEKAASELSLGGDRVNPAELAVAWEMVSCPAKEKVRLDHLLGQGWEPFAVTVAPEQMKTSNYDGTTVYYVHVVWLRRVPR